MTPAVFIKRGPAFRAANFAAEAEGLAALAATGTVRTPAVIDHGIDEEGRAFIALEHFELQQASAPADAELGRALARLHRTIGEAHGWHKDNFIGLSAQPNGLDEDWPRFFATRRLGVQLTFAAESGHRGRLQDLGNALMERLPSILAHTPAPSLLHGDLWGGNHGMLADGTPVVFDPAVHYGDRECDLAMADLFGGFAGSFHEAYMAEWPLPEGWQVRRPVYQLYHVLNHLNLFGASYLRQAEQLADSV